MWGTAFFYEWLSPGLYLYLVLQTVAGYQINKLKKVLEEMLFIKYGESYQNIFQMMNLIENWLEKFRWFNSMHKVELRI